MSLGHAQRRRIVPDVVAAIISLCLAFGGAVPATLAFVAPFATLVTSPSGGATVSGKVPLGGHASADASEGHFTLANGGAPINVPASHGGNLQDWTADWDSVTSPDGAYTVTFAATSAADGTSATSAPVTFTVANGATPAPPEFTVTVATPTEGATVLGGVPLSATTSAAADSLSFVLTPAAGGSLVSVPANGQNGGTTWTATWDSTAVLNGGYTLVARSFHGGTMTESAQRSVTVSNASSPSLNVTLGSPTGGATVSGPVPLAATTNIAASSVSFVIRNGTGTVVASPIGASATGTAWTATWDSTVAPNGTYALKAVATKDATTAESPSVPFTVSNAAAAPPPEPVTVTLLAPANGAAVSGSVPLSASTSATPDELAFIVTQAFGDHQATVIPASGSGGSWTASWPSAAATNGSYTIVARATKNGTDTTSAAATVSLNNASNAALTCIITSPAAGVTLSGGATFMATTSVAADALGFVLRDPLHPDTVVATAVASGSSGNTSWNATLDTATVPNGTYALVARATKAGVVTPSAPVSVTVSNAASSGTTPVSFTVTLPAADATLTGPVVLSATSDQPIDGFTFTVTPTTAGAAPIALTATGDATKTVWNAAWDTRSVPNGDYDLGTTAVKAGAKTAGSPRRFKVSNASVAVTITSPSANAEVSGTKEVLVAVGATVSGVAVKITNASNAAVTTTRNAAYDAGRQVWVVAWNTADVVNGSYRIEAKATDAQSHVFLAEPVTVKVSNATTSSGQFSVRVTVPAAGATVSGTVGLAASVAGEAVSVQFFMSPGSGEIRRADAHFDATRRLWVAAWLTTENPNGAYTVGAVAVNSSNVRAESDKVAVTVSNASSPSAPTASTFSVRLVEPAGGDVAGKVRLVARTEGPAAGVRFFVKLKGTTLQRSIAGVGDADHLSWTAEWDTAPEAVGTYDLVAVAKNAAGTEAASQVVTMYLERQGETPSQPAPDGAQQSVVILRPSADAVLRGAVGLVAGSPLAAKVKFVVRGGDGKEVFGHDAVKNDLAWAVLWDTSRTPDGKYRVEAEAYGTSGERIGAASVGVTVANAGSVAPSGPIDAVPLDAVKDAIREAPPGSTPLVPEQMPKEAGDGAAKLAAECASRGIPAERCARWFANKPDASECRSAGIITKEECLAFLKRRHGDVPGCEGKDAAACGEEMARKTAGLLDVRTLHAMKDAVEPHIGDVLRVAPRGDVATPDTGAPVPGDGVGKDAPPDMTALMPFANHRLMAVRVHASPSFVATSDDMSHEAMPAVLFVDTDGDGLPDDLEKRLGTDPGLADTDGDGFSDGTEVAKGYNPLGKGRLADSGRALAPVDVAIVSGAPIEQPRSAGVERDDLKVDEAATKREGGVGTVLKGRGRPGEIVTVFVYSYLPVVFTTTVSDDGTWEYDLGSELTDGEHEVYATVTDDSGKITSKSGALSFFVSEAKAVGADEFFKAEQEASPVAAAKVQAPVRRLAGMYVVGGGVLIAAALLLSYLLFMRPKRPSPPSQ